MRKLNGVNARIIKATAPIKKAEVSTEIQSPLLSDGEFVAPQADLKGFKWLVNHSSILPQCIRAYKNNIAGFGIGVRYKDDSEETPEMKAEWDKITEVLEYLNLDQDTKEVFEDIIEGRETYGIAYLEVIRNLAGEVVGIEFINDIPSVRKTTPLEPYVEIEYDVNGKTETRQKKFRKYRQQLNGQTVFFKEIGDPRIMDLRTGTYDENIPIEYQANELLEFAIGTEHYGEVRWLGTVLNVDGSKKAEGLNNRYFSEGRHTPLMLMINGGTLTDESFAKLQSYVNDIKGENGQHAFIVLEAENLENRTDMETDQKPSIEVVKMADILQKDELFQDYLNNNRRKVQSAFQLPDLYVGYTTDFNRATAQSAQEVTEKQVFQPERQSLAWIINNKLLADYHFKYVEAYFLGPDISNPDDLFKLLSVCNGAGGLTPNKAKEIIYKAYGETSENYEGEWADQPLAITQLQGAGDSGAPEEGLDGEINRQVQKSVENGDEEIAVVLKEIRKLLVNNSSRLFTLDGNNDTIKKDFDEDAHPRDEHGRFTSGGGSESGSSDSESETADSGSDNSQSVASNFGNAKPKEFCEAAQVAKVEQTKQHPEKAWRVTTMSEEEFEKEHPGSLCHITPGGSVAAVTPDGDIVCVCGMPNDSTRGWQLLAMAVEAGGNKLDSYEGNHSFYIRQGFEPVSWCKWNDEYAPSDWDSYRDAPEDIIFYKHTGKTSKYAKIEDFKKDIPVSRDYDTARKARDDSI